MLTCCHRCTRASAGRPARILHGSSSTTALQTPPVTLYNHGLTKELFKSSTTTKRMEGYDTARDLAYETCNTELIVSCDSDDYLPDDAVEQIFLGATWNDGMGHLPSIRGYRRPSRQWKFLKELQKPLPRIFPISTRSSATSRPCYEPASSQRFPIAGLPW